MARANPLRVRPRWTNSPQIQAAMARITRKRPSQSTPLFPKRGAVNQNNQTAVASMGNPMAILNFSIQAPGFGRTFKIGRASCRERVYISYVSGLSKENDAEPRCTLYDI